ncbi:reverse transcriptase family protein [Ancylobacter defluvii]|uniref:Reverse transcriptase domain-containing protein n=1 Tax=Ancylobacter defluvii TaxID=1282440 RepID=A0A9W6JU09_9HYPH|nr:reverse transcriptase family protein [Ancylobacter defluvii]MBS7590264.1 RNA-directed DNA polymerase [Ancylobacter defluvii]GLK83177.1 hypothetical protein GCM10017653_12460 [Ancylobacter defluvii]
MAPKNKASLRIEDCWLFAVASKEDLARRLSTDRQKISVSDLERLSADAGNYRLFSIRQGTKERPVQEPKRELQQIHARIHRLLSRVVVPEYLHSAVKGKSYLTNAREHGHGISIIKIDVKKFFPSVPRFRVFTFFKIVMKCRKDVSGLLADLITFDQRLPTGSSASPIIAYYAFKPMFDEISRFAESAGLKMSCYVDDMTFSGSNANRFNLYEIHKIISKYGLKSHKMKYFVDQEPKIITGVCNTPSGERVPNKLHLKISIGFEELRAAKSHTSAVKLLRPLLGRLDAAGQIDPRFRARALTLRSTFKTKSRISNGAIKGRV